MPNPFELPSRGAEDERPLCPWQIPEHEHYYVPVDHTQNAFETFQGEMRKTLDGTATRWTVLVRGPQGCGKSALANRCTYWLQRESEQSGIDTRVIDLRDAGLNGVDVGTRVAHVCRRLLDRLSIQRIFDAADEARLEERSSVSDQLLPLMADLLEAKQSRLVVLTPPLELGQEAQIWAQAARPFLMFFCETFDAALPGGQAASSRAIVLDVGPLDIKDGWAFVESRLARAVSGDYPLIEEETVRKFMQKRIAHRGMTTILELQRTCATVLGAAIAKSRDTVTYEDFQDYYWGV